MILVDACFLMILVDACVLMILVSACVLMILVDACVLMILVDACVLMILVDQGCATFLVGGPYNKTSDIKRATLKIYFFHLHNKFKNSHNIFNILTYIYFTYRVNHDRPF